MASAKSMAKLFRASATETIIRLGESRLIPKRFMLSLLGECDCAWSVEHLTSYLNQHDYGHRSTAIASLKALSCKEATIALWQIEGELTKKLRSRLERISDSSMRKLVRELAEEDQLSLLDERYARTYFKKRGLFKSTYKRFDSSEYTRTLLRRGGAYDQITSRRLDSLTTDELAQCISQLSEFNREWYFTKDQEMAAYLKGRGIANPFEKRQPFINAIAERTGISKECLGWICRHWRKIEPLYKGFEVPKRNGRKRQILAPCGLLKSVQRAIYSTILSPAELASSCHGFRKGCSIATNAAPHVAKEVVLNVDLQDFFPSVSAARVYGIFRSLGWNEIASRFLTRVCTYEGYLPQGAPTSPILANLVCRHLDKRLAGLARIIEASYTRYADDLTFSGDRRIVSALPVIRKIVTSERLRISNEKVRITRRGNRQEVTGLVVNDKVSVSRKVRRQLRAALHHMEHRKPVRWKGCKADLSVISGEIAFLQAVQPDAGELFRRQFKSICRTASGRNHDTR